MKGYLSLICIIITLGTGLLMSCIRYNDDLDTAEQMLDYNVDSTLVILQSINHCDLVEHDYNRYLLLYAMAKNKAEIPIDNLQDIKRMVSYYVQSGDGDAKMKAYYMLGCAYRDRGEVPSAIKSYNSAISYADTIDSDCDIKTLSRIYGQLATMYDIIRCPQYELRAERKAVDMALKAKDTISAICFYEHLADGYRLMEHYDSAMTICDSAYSMYMARDKTDMACAAIGNTAMYLLEIGRVEEARARLDKYRRFSNFFDDEGNIIKGKEMYYSLEAMYYEAIDDIDSAKYYYEKLLHVQDDLYCVEIAYKGLMSVYNKMHDPSMVEQYALLYCHINDSLSVVKSSEDAIRYQALYDYTSAMANAEKVKDLLKIHRLWFVVILFVLATLAIIYILVARMRTERDRKRLLESNEIYSNLLYKYNDLQEELKKMTEDAQLYKNEKEREIASIRQQLLFYETDIDRSDAWDIEHGVMESHIAKRLHAKASKGKMATTAELEEFVSFVRTNITSYEDILTNYNLLSAKETTVCSLVRLKFIPSEIMVLMDMSLQSVTNHKSRINKKLFGDKSAATLEMNLLNYDNEK